MNRGKTEGKNTVGIWNVNFRKPICYTFTRTRKTALSLVGLAVSRIILGWNLTLFRFIVNVF